MSLAQGFIQLGAGLSVGLAGLAAGFAIGIVGDAGVRGTAQQPRLFVGMVRAMTSISGREVNSNERQILILIFAEVLGLYGTLHVLCRSYRADSLAGLIVALIMNGTTTNMSTFVSPIFNYSLSAF